MGGLDPKRQEGDGGRVGLGKERQGVGGNGGAGPDAELWPHWPHHSASFFTGNLLLQVIKTKFR